LTLGNQPQLISAPRIRKDLKITPSGQPDIYSNAIGSLRRAEMVRFVGCIQGTQYYVWTDAAKNYIKIDPDIIHYWINYGKNWFEPYDKANFVETPPPECCGQGCENHENRGSSFDEFEDEDAYDDPYEDLCEDPYSGDDKY